MIIEDENGREWTTEELRDDYREPTEPDPESPLTLEEIQAALDAPHTGGTSVECKEAAALLIDRAVPQLLAELAAARERLARYEATPTREEWTVTADAATPPVRDAWFYTADAALQIAARGDLQAWRRVVTHGPVVVRPWEPIATEPPF